MSTAPQIDYEKIKGVHKIPLEELYTSGHRTCQGCESATTMRGFIKVAGSRTVVTGATGCMNELPRHPQMEHPNGVTIEKNQDVLGHSPNPNYGLAFQVLR